MCLLLRAVGGASSLSKQVQLLFTQNHQYLVYTLLKLALLMQAPGRLVRYVLDSYPVGEATKTT